MTTLEQSFCDKEGFITTYPPPIKEDVLILCKYKDPFSYYNYRIAHRYNEQWFTNTGSLHIDILGWKTLPSLKELYENL